MAYGVYSDRGYREHILEKNKNTNKTEVFTQEDQSFTGRKTFLSGVTTSDLEVQTVEVSESLKVKGKDISEIIDYLPNDVSKENKLTTEAFVNSSISTNTANFLGTFNTLEEIEALTAVTNNAYAFWKTTDTLGSVVFKRYKYIADEQLWKFEYDLNNSSFTAKQWEAINSGITAELVTQIGQGGGGVPAGTVLSFAGDTEPEGFLFTEGQEILRNAYPNLFAVIGTTYGEGDGETTFNLPDYREMVLVGAGQNAKLDIKVHDVYDLGKFKDDQMQGHSHNFEWSNGNPNNSYGGLMSGGGSYNSVTTGKTVLTIKGVATDGENGTPRVGSTTHSKQIGIKYIIKY